MRIESPEIDSLVYHQLILDKQQRQNNGAKIVISTNDAQTTGHPQAKKKNVSRHRTYLFHKINSK